MSWVLAQVILDRSRKNEFRTLPACYQQMADTKHGDNLQRMGNITVGVIYNRRALRSIDKE